jgi:hypothetical protein
LDVVFVAIDLEGAISKSHCPDEISITILDARNFICMPDITTTEHFTLGAKMPQEIRD